MGLFKTKLIEVQEPIVFPTEIDREYDLRQSAIQYIVRLKKADKDRFFEAVDLIWSGYNKLDSVKTENERALNREQKKMNMTDDDVDELGDGFLLDDIDTGTPIEVVDKNGAENGKR
jgi:hypothetical protein